MASRSLGTLSIDLIAKIGGFVEGMSRAERAADTSARKISASQRKMLKEVEKDFSRLRNVIAGGIAGITIAGVFSKFVQESKAAQQEQAQLAAVLKSTGQAAGYSAKELNAMSAAMAGKSTFSEGEITKAQTRLLSYTGVVGKAFPEAMQATIDMAARMGMSIEQSAETVGRALDTPSQGLNALSRQGFRFTEEQKKLVKALEDAGRPLEAQKIILDALKSSYGGAAEASRKTFGGAISALQKQLGTLLTGSDGSLQGATDAVNKLAETLSSETVKSAFATLTSALAGIIELLVTATSEFINFGKFVGESLGKWMHGSDDAVERMGDNIKGLRLELEMLEKEIARPRKFSSGNGYDSVEDLIKRAEDIRKQIATLDSARNSLLNSRLMGGALEQAKPKTKDEGKKVAIVDPEALKRSLDSQLKTLERYIGRQQEILAQRNKFLDLYNNMGVLSIQEYYQRQQNILDEATANQVKAYDDQIKALRNYIARAPKAQDRARSQEQINDLLDKQAKLQRDVGIAAIEAGFQQQQAAKEMERAFRDVNIQLLEIQGRSAEAARLRVQDQFEDVTNRATVEGRGDVLRQVDQIKELTIAQADLNRLSGEYQFIMDSLSIQQDRIALAQQMGLHGELDGLQKLGRARQASYEQLQAIVVEYEKIAILSGDEKMIQAADRLRLQLDQLGAELDPIAQRIDAIFSDSLGDAFSDFITGAKSAKDAFTDFANSVVSQISKIVAQNLAQSLFAQATGGSGFNIGSFFSGLFGGGKANGGPTQPNTLYRVNERGPELFSTRDGAQYLMTGAQGGNVTPNNMLGGGVNQTINFYNNGPIDRRTQTQLATEAYKGARVAASRNG